jgi:putative oxidoreductase
MKDLLFKTNNDWAGLVLRMTAGIIMLPHGMQKLFGVFGGYGFRATMEYFTNVMKLPWTISFLVVVIECFGALALIAGLASRIWAAALIIVMIGAICTTNHQHGLFMNWNGNQAGEGFEYHLLFIGVCTSIMIIGSGRYSVDSLLLQCL